ncbi:hypothetical protein DFH06DRAFT_1392486 [Mycena polygramma]|nr:hypothetical protein DFH06DRAFT_1392486 [Mycena polygramma]
MRFIYITVATALVSMAAASALPAVLLSRAPPYPPAQLDCIEFGKYIGTHDNTGTYSPACASVTEACLKENGTSIWSHAACVAAATCQGTYGVIILNQCQNPNVLPASSIPNWSAAIYGSIVGDCASFGCPITQQNYIDFVYGQMSLVNVTNAWPSSVNDVISQWWDPITAWTATGNSIPYSNFNDWLHWSSS